jgi:hypothetical protein
LKNGSNLRGAKWTESIANLLNIKGISAKVFWQAKTLYKVRLEKGFKKQVEKECKNSLYSEDFQNKLVELPDWDK